MLHIETTILIVFKDMFLKKVSKHHFKKNSLKKKDSLYSTEQTKHLWREIKKNHPYVSF